MSNSSVKGAHTLFVNGHYQKGKIDDFYVGPESRKQREPLSGEQLQYMLHEKQTYASELAKMQRTIVELKQALENKTLENRTLRSSLERHQREFEVCRRMRKQICEIVIELEQYKKYER